MNLANPSDISGSTSLHCSERPNGPLLTSTFVVPALIAVGCLIAGLWYSYFTVQNFRHQGIVHVHGSLLAFATLGGSVAWMLNAFCLRQHRWTLSIVSASLGIGCLMWISTLT